MPPIFYQLRDQLYSKLSTSDSPCGPGIDLKDISKSDEDEKVGDEPGSVDSFGSGGAAGSDNDDDMKYSFMKDESSNGEVEKCEKKLDQL